MLGMEVPNDLATRPSRIAIWGKQLQPGDILIKDQGETVSRKAVISLMDEIEDVLNPPPKKRTKKAEIRAIVREVEWEDRNSYDFLGGGSTRLTGYALCTDLDEDREWHLIIEERTPLFVERIPLTE